MTKSFFLSWLLWFAGLAAMAQNTDNIREETLTAVYYLPSNRNGLTESHFRITANVAILRGATQSEIRLNLRAVQSTPANMDPRYLFSYTYQGQQYGDGRLGKDVFTGIRAVLIWYEVTCMHGSAQEWTRIVDGRFNLFGPVAKDLKASDVKIFVKVARLGFSGQNRIEEKIRGLKTQEEEARRPKPVASGSASPSSPATENPAAASRRASTPSGGTSPATKQSSAAAQNSSSSNGNGGTRSRSAANSSTANPSRGGSGIIDVSGPVTVNGEKVKVYQQEGKYYMQAADGSTHETSQTAYERVHQADTKNKTNRANSAAASDEKAAQDAEALRQFHAGQAAMVERFSQPIQPAPNAAAANVAAVATVVGELAASSERNRQERIRQYYANQAAAKEMREIKGRARFEQFYYNKYMAAADKGDKRAQMLLYFASSALLSENFTPEFQAKRQAWGDRALASNNPDILTEKGASYMADNLAEGLPYLEKAASLGSIDALIILGNYYDGKPFTSNMGGKYFEKKGGQDPVKAFAYYTKAAEAGSPWAQYCLGMIYRHGTTVASGSRMYNVRYDGKSGIGLALDEAKAFQFMLASYQPEYMPSLYGRRYNNGSTFHFPTFSGLVEFYAKGISVPKDKQKAKELEAAGTVYYESSRLNGRPYAF